MTTAAAPEPTATAGTTTTAPAKPAGLGSKVVSMVRWLLPPWGRKPTAPLSVKPTADTTDNTSAPWQASGMGDFDLDLDGKKASREAENKVKVTLPGASDFDGFEGEVVADIPGNTDKPEDVPALVYAGMASLIEAARTGVNNALGELQGLMDEYRTKLRDSQDKYAQTAAAAKAQLIAEVKPELTTWRTAKALKAKEVAELRRIKADLPKQIENAEFSITGDPRIRVGYITSEMKNKMKAATALITTFIGGIDLVLASAVFVAAADETTGWVIGGTYAALLAFYMHQSAYYGRQEDANEEANQSLRYHRQGTPEEKRTVRSLSEIVVKRARQNYNRLWVTGVSMAAIRLLIAAVTGEWKGSAVALVITVVAFAIALAGVEILKKYMPPYGDEHQTIGDMKKRFEGIDAEIAAAENKDIAEPQGLAKAKTKYGKAIENAQNDIPNTGKTLLQNGKNILESETAWLGQAKDRFVQACMAVLELVVEVAPEEPIEESELLTHFEARGTNHPLAEELRRGTVVFGGFDTTVQTADTIVAEVDRITPVIEAPKPEPVKDTAPKKPVKLTLKKVRK